MKLAVDTSAIIAIQRGEPAAVEVMHALERSSRSLISSATVVEAGMVLGSPAEADRMLVALNLSVVPVDEQHMRAAMSAWERFGRGRHRARLNFGDCFSYATALVAGAPLLFVGEDFTHTDVESVLMG